MANLINDTEKKEINESLKSVKQGFNNLAGEFGYQKKNSNSIDIRTKNREDKIKENLLNIIFLEAMLYIVIIIGAINLFVNDHILLGILILLLIPIICSVTIVCCLKYVKSTDRNLFDIWEKKIKKVVKSYKFQIGVVITCFVIFFIVMIIIVNVASHNT